MSETDHSAYNAPASLALPFIVCALFIWGAFGAATCDTNAGRTQTLERPTQVDLSSHYTGCKGTPTQVSNCYFSKQK